MCPNNSRIAVCVCTFKRPELLDHLLSKLKTQRTDNLFTYAVTIVDNDVAESARQVAQSHAAAGLDVGYHVEPEQNIARARNRAVANANADFVAFIDDDEFPGPDWLLTLLTALREYNADGVLGPVLPYFEEPPPDWIVRGKFYERPVHATGTILEWTSTRTGNVLLDGRIMRGEATVFDPRLGSGGEDRDFFKRMIERGCKFVWCNEGPVHEVVPPQRWSKSFLLRRALLRGQQYMTSASYSKMTVPTSLIAIPAYGVALPFLWLAGEHHFMKYLIKICDHLGKCLAGAGINVVKEKYITE
jgi:succinoglycan biosynthesis protein ExoM